MHCALAGLHGSSPVAECVSIYFHNGTKLTVGLRLATSPDALKAVESQGDSRAGQLLDFAGMRGTKPAPSIPEACINELPERRHSTQQSHFSTLNRWIRPRWGNLQLEQVKPVAVEEWLRSLTLAPKTKVNLRSLFHLIYEHARRWELTDRNPIDLVRQRGGRRCIPRVQTPGEICLLLEQLAEPYHTMVLVAACLGLPASEIMGLQWADFNWEDLTVLIRRGVVNGKAGDTKTEASRRPLPIDPRLAEPLQKLQKRSLHAVPQDWSSQTALADPEDNNTSCSAISGQRRYGVESERLAGTPFAIRTRQCCEPRALTSRCSKNCCGIRPFRTR